MMVGLLAVGASAVTINDYKDKDAIKHKEAVAVLSAINVLQGDDQGTFRPTAPLTRAESAAFFARLCATNGAGVSSFTDMGAYAWAQPYVAYCERAGIIAGRGDGTFGPGESIAYVAWAKMCLGALGYDAQIEGLVGGQWEINTIKLVNQLGLSTGVADFDWNAPITRDDAAQFAFNTLKSTMVTYDEGLNVNVKTGDTDVEVKQNGTADELKNKTYDYRSNGTEKHPHDADNDMQLVENYFPTTKFTSTTDKYGIKTNMWFGTPDRQNYKLTETNVKATAVAANVLATYTTTVALVTPDTLYKDGGFSKTVTHLSITENGKATTKTVLPAKGVTTAFVLSEYAGATVYLVDDTGDGVANSLLVKYPLLAKVTGIVKAEDSPSKERQVELTVYTTNNSIHPTTTVKADAAFETESFSKGEFVLYYPDATIENVVIDAQDNKLATGAIELTTVDSGIGTLGKVNLAGGYVNALTVDSVRYSVGGTYLAAMGPDSKVVATSEYGKYGLNKEITLYTSNGYVLGVNTTATPLADYVFIMGIGEHHENLITGVETYDVAYVKQDGTTVTSTVAAEATKTDTQNKYENKWAIATPRGDTTVFSNLTDGKTIGATLSPKNPSIGGATANNKTNFIVLSGSGAGTNVKAYAGISAVPTFSDPTTAYVLKDSDNKAAAVFFNYKSKTPDSTAANALFFLTATPDGTIQDGPSTYYTFNTVDSKGNVAQVSVASTAKLDGADITNWNAPLTQAGLYVPETNEKGVITALKTPTSAKGYLEGIGHIADAAHPISAGDGVITGTTAHTVASDAAIYRFNFLGQMKTVDDLEDLDGRTGTLAVVASMATGKVTTIFFMG
jgi:hypothetical protein